MLNCRSDTKRLAELILENLTLTNFKVFQGQHSFDLVPRQEGEFIRPIILFGGMNGAGKTTILTAIQTALYGRHVLGFGTSEKNYKSYLKNSIHKYQNNDVQESYAMVELSFTHTHSGNFSNYKVKRAWKVADHEVTESLQIFQNGDLLQNLNYDQCQNFLSELIPIGISELFFFDGERIKQLAEDRTGMALAQAIKKLLGLDIIDRLRGDLYVLLRKLDIAKTTGKLKKGIQTLEEQLETCESQIEMELSAYEQVRIQYYHLCSELDQLTLEVSSKGGAWILSQEDEIKNLTELNTKQNAIEENIRGLLSGAYPLSLAKPFTKRVLCQLNDEYEWKRKIVARSSVERHLKNLKITLNGKLQGKALNIAIASIDAEINNTECIMENSRILHDISDSHCIRIERIISESIDKLRIHVGELSRELSYLYERIDVVEENIARAPDQGILASDFRRINEKHRAISDSRAKMEVHRENARRALRTAMDITRKLNILHEEIFGIADSNRVTNYGANARNLLEKFAEILMESKVRKLEEEFTKSFRRLAHKEDAIISATINPQTFCVGLKSNRGHLIDRNDLSAGEKQIYAISLLEALARTSGRKLPIIVDTPLARLDSVHRVKLIKNYFPFASHQVLILSTDTEVDQLFCTELREHISHAFRLDYDSKSDCTGVKEGYFWKVA